MNIDYASLFPGLDGFAKSLSSNFGYNIPALTFNFHGLEESQDVSASDGDNHPVGREPSSTS